MRAFEAFRETNDERLVSLERRSAADPLTDEKLARIDRTLDEAKRIADELAIKAARPRLGGGATSSPAVREHKAAFETYVRNGEDGSLRALEQKALSVGTGTDGGYLVPDEIERAVNRRVQGRVADPRHRRRAPGVGLGLPQAVRRQRRGDRLGRPRPPRGPRPTARCWRRSRR